MKKIKLTVAQAIIKYINNQFIQINGIEIKFFKGCFGILGHGNVGGIGQAIQVGFRQAVILPGLITTGWLA